MSNKMPKNNLLDFISESVERSKKNKKEYSFGHGYVFVKDPLPENIDLEYVLQTIEDIIPPDLRVGVDSIMVGDFEEFHERSVNALFKDGGYEIYALEPNITTEFRNKRMKLKEMLNQQKISTQGFDFSDVEYNLEFDDYLYTTVGYPVLESLSVGIFSDAYAITSIREYFASGFEAYFLGNRDYLKKVSPVLHQKIKELLEDV